MRPYPSLISFAGFSFDFDLDRERLFLFGDRDLDRRRLDDRSRDSFWDFRVESLKILVECYSYKKFYLR